MTTARNDEDPTAIDIEFDPTQKRMRGRAYHGGVDFDVPYISKVKGAFNLYQGGCADGLRLPIDIEHLVSLYPWEQYRVLRPLDTRLEVRMYDSVNDGPDMEQVVQIATWVNQCREQGPTLVHCQAGLNRSGLVTAIALILGGCTPEEAIDMLRASRSPAVLCNPVFQNMVLGFEP